MGQLKNQARTEDAERVRAARKALGLNQVQCAALIDVHNVTLCRWEKSQLAPSAYKVLLLEALASAAKARAPGEVERWIGFYGPVSTLCWLLRTGQQRRIASI